MPELINLDQRTQRWHELRQGRITASTIKNVLSKKVSVWERYRNTLIKNDNACFTNKSIEWGVKNEKRALRFFELQTGIDVHEVGFVIPNGSDDIGCSPDGLIGKNEGLEIKCPFNGRNHFSFLSNKRVPAQYRAQVQACLWMTERESWYFVSYDPRLPFKDSLAYIKVYRDDDYIKVMEERVNKFIRWWKHGEPIQKCIS